MCSAAWTCTGLEGKLTEGLIGPKSPERILFCGWRRDMEDMIMAKCLPYSQAHGGSFSKGSWIREMKQASDKTLIISEFLDPRTKNLLSMSKTSDYVLLNELVSMALAMVA